MHIEIIIFWILLIDAISANLIIWFGEKWYTKHLGVLTRILPPAKGWALIYLVLVLWIGSILYR